MKNNHYKKIYFFKFDLTKIIIRFFLVKILKNKQYINNILFKLFFLGDWGLDRKSVV